MLIGIQDCHPCYRFAESFFGISIATAYQLSRLMLLFGSILHLNKWWPLPLVCWGKWCSGQGLSYVLLLFREITVHHSHLSTLHLFWSPQIKLWSLGSASESYWISSPLDSFENLEIKFPLQHNTIYLLSPPKSPYEGNIVTLPSVRR